jgi:hypothetical protein
MNNKIRVGFNFITIHSNNTTEYSHKIIDENTHEKFDLVLDIEEIQYSKKIIGIKIKKNTEYNEAKIIESLSNLDLERNNWKIEKIIFPIDLEVGQQIFLCLNDTRTTKEYDYNLNVEFPNKEEKLDIIAKNLYIMYSNYVNLSEYDGHKHIEKEKLFKQLESVNERWIRNYEEISKSYDINKVKFETQEKILNQIITSKSDLDTLKTLFYDFIKKK